MANGVNKVILVGFCCADPEVKFTQNQNAITNVSIATNETWKDKQTGQKQERAEFHRIVFFNRLAEIAGEYLRKGSQVYIEGALRTRKWQDQQGQDKYTTEIVANEMQMLGGRGDNAGGGQAPQQGGHQQPAPNQGYQTPQYGSQSQPQRPQNNQAAPSNYANVPHASQQGSPQSRPASGANMDDFDDDIPF